MAKSQLYWVFESELKGTDINPAAAALSSNTVDWTSGQLTSLAAADDVFQAEARGGTAQCPWRCLAISNSGLYSYSRGWGLVRLDVAGWQGNPANMLRPSPARRLTP